MGNERTKVANEILEHLKMLSACFLELQRVERDVSVKSGTPDFAAGIGSQHFATVSREYSDKAVEWQRCFAVMGIKL